MRDSYVGDIGDYAKYGLLRRLAAKKTRIAINWYYLNGGSSGDDGKFINYLDELNYAGYAEYDKDLFRILSKLVNRDKIRDVGYVEKLSVGARTFFKDPVPANKEQRNLWHKRALARTEKAEIVFLDPDNGAASENMTRKGIASPRHVLWSEIKDYYDRGQSVLLYQHRPRSCSREDLIADMRERNDKYLKASIEFADFSAWQNRYVFFFYHDCHRDHSEDLRLMNNKWEQARTKKNKSSR